MNKYTPEQIINVINVILNKFQEVYCTPQYYGEFSNAIEKFTEGYCGIFALILKNIFSNGIFFHLGNEKFGHIILKIDNFFYDATGIVPEEIIKKYTLTKLDAIYEAVSTLPWDFLYNTEKFEYYNTMIDICTNSGNEYLENHKNKVNNKTYKKIIT